MTEKNNAQTPGPAEVVEGHLLARLNDQGDDDVQAHRMVNLTDDDNEDDVEGHVQPRRDIDIER